MSWRLSWGGEEKHLEAVESLKLAKISLQNLEMSFCSFWLFRAVRVAAVMRNDLCVNPVGCGDVEGDSFRLQRCGNSFPFEFEINLKWLIWKFHQTVIFPHAFQPTLIRHLRSEPRNDTSQKKQPAAERSAYLWDCGRIITKIEFRWQRSSRPNVPRH